MVVARSSLSPLSASTLSPTFPAPPSAVDLGLRLVHVDTSRAEEIADTVMALFLRLLRRTHLLSRHSLSASSWLSSVQPLYRGMRRFRDLGLVLGIVRSGSRSGS